MEYDVFKIYRCSMCGHEHREKCEFRQRQGGPITSLSETEHLGYLHHLVHALDPILSLGMHACEDGCVGVLAFVGGESVAVNPQQCRRNRIKELRSVIETAFTFVPVNWIAVSEWSKELGEIAEQQAKDGL